VAVLKLRIGGYPVVWRIRTLLCMQGVGLLLCQHERVDTSGTSMLALVVIVLEALVVVAFVAFGAAS
jgi:hypothetical protein